MWKSINGRLANVTDESRFKFRTNISKKLIEELNELAEKHNTYPNYLLETGMNNLLEEGIIVYDKKLRPKDRIQFKTSYDKELLTKIKAFAKDNKLCTNDVIEYSFKFIDFEKCKKKNHRHRIEKGAKQ